jgi:hypothetical protein
VNNTIGEFLLPLDAITASFVYIEHRQVILAIGGNPHEYANTKIAGTGDDKWTVKSYDRYSHRLSLLTLVPLFVFIASYKTSQS